MEILCSIREKATCSMLNDYKKINKKFTFLKWAVTKRPEKEQKKNFGYIFFPFVVLHSCKH